MIQSKADFIEYIDALALSASKKRPAWFGDEIAVVTRSFPEGHMTIAGVPAKKISDADFSANIARLRLLCNREWERWGLSPAFLFAIGLRVQLWRNHISAK